MITSKLLLVLALASTLGAASAQSFHPAAAGKETTTRPWTAPVGHRQPRASDVPATTMGPLDQEDAYIDSRIAGICRGC
ncbi:MULTISPECIES: hypothetical protein [unclassified Bradyrhizobium]|uniref:hypothetical protein n=1 Tax=unclassified Bradyrhizobium TaxID=2631580 RepID=UPI0024B1981D|nr:hypothetical protein [Bradyrhizobium sp. CB2312]WFU72198.1 hypothetical protein QA642_44865 [Bradyrhizobium sp. CB2312]